MLLTRVTRWSGLKAWGTRLAKRIGRKKAIVALARRPSCCIGSGRMAPSSAGRRRSWHELLTDHHPVPPRLAERRPWPERGDGDPVSVLAASLAEMTAHLTSGGRRFQRHHAVHKQTTPGHLCSAQTLRSSLVSENSIPKARSIRPTGYEGDSDHT